MATPANTISQRAEIRRLPVSRSLLNILSIRSVMRNPPTTFVEEQQTARKPKKVLNGS